MTEAYPLSWPASRPRTPAAQRKRAAFSKKGDQNEHGWRPTNQLSIAQAVSRLDSQVALLQNARGRYYAVMVVSTNVELTKDGLPRSDRRAPVDPGVAVYFHANGTDYCMPCDKWDRVADNIAAVAGHIEAIRRIERYGVQTLNDAFSGFVALPPSGDRPWRQVLELHRAGPVTMDHVQTMFRRLALERHPDHGGSHEMMAELNAAIDAARREIGQ